MPADDKPFGAARGGSDSPADDRSPAATGSTDAEAAEVAKVANRFDIRRLIGGLFAIYGLILLVLGLAGSHQVKNKAAGINIDLYTGIGMLVFATVMIGWALSKPVVPEAPETRGEGTGEIRRAPAT